MGFDYTALSVVGVGEHCYVERLWLVPLTVIVVTKPWLLMFKSSEFERPRRAEVALYKTRIVRLQQRSLLLCCRMGETPRLAIKYNSATLEHTCRAHIVVQLKTASKVAGASYFNLPRQRIINKLKAAWKQVGSGSRIRFGKAYSNRMGRPGFGFA